MNIAIVAVIIPQVKDLTDVSIRKLSVVNTDEYGNDDYSIIKAVEESLVEEFKVKTAAKLPNGIRMNIVKRDVIEDVNQSADDICTKFLLDEVFGMYTTSNNSIVARLQQLATINEAAIAAHLASLAGGGA